MGTGTRRDWVATGTGLRTPPRYTHTGRRGSVGGGRPAVDLPDPGVDFRRQAYRRPRFPGCRGVLVARSPVLRSRTPESASPSPFRSPRGPLPPLPSTHLRGKGLGGASRSPVRHARRLVLPRTEWTLYVHPYRPSKRVEQPLLREHLWPHDSGVPSLVVRYL